MPHAENSLRGKSNEREREVGVTFRDKVDRIIDCKILLSHNFSGFSVFRAVAADSKPITSRKATEVKEATQKRCQGEGPTLAVERKF
jgi:hypothetical protein